MDKGFKFSGGIIAEVDPVLLEGKLTLVKAPGDHWDPDRLYKYLAQEGVKEGFSKKDLEAQIEKFIASREDRITFVFARGNLPVPATPEEIEWVEFIIPPDLEAVSKRLFQKNPNPAVFEIRTEKVEIRTPVEVKGGIFGQKKTETKVSFETREIREHVAVPTQVLAAGFFEAGAQLGSLFPPKPGKPGRDLAGHSVPAPSPAAVKYFLGDGIEKTREGYKTSVTGFVRRGKNWLEVVPYQPHLFHLHYTQDKTGAFLDFTPGSVEAPLVDAQAVLQKLEEDSFPIERVIGKGEIESAIRKALQTGAAFRGFSLTGTADGRYEVSISADKLTARLQVHKPSGKGAPLNLAQLETDLKELQIKTMNLQEVMKEVKSFLASDRTVLEDFVIAKGRAPTRNPDRVLKFRVDFASQEQLKAVHQRLLSNKALLEATPGLNEFPLEKVQKAARVSAESVVAVLDHGEGTPGTTGTDIYGNTVPAFPGNDPNLAFFGNIRRAGDSVVAFEDGMVELLEEAGRYLLRLRKHKDAVVEVFHSPDHMSARMNLYQAVGSGEPLTTTLIDDVLKQEQVLEGINREAIAKALEQARKTGKAEAVEVARGQAPGSNLLARLDFQVETKRDQKKDLTMGAAVPGGVIAYFNPPDGTCGDGVDIMGNVIPCAESEILELKLGAGLIFKPLEGTSRLQILAERGGEFLFDGQRMQLKDTLLLPHGARKQEGNRKFAGHIAIEGDVEAGLAIYAGGDLKVNGSTGACLLSGGVNVIVAGMVKGEGKAVLSSKKHLSVHQAEKAILMSVGDTIIQHTALGCTFKCNGRIRQSKPEGTIAGGTLRAKYGLEVHNLGHPSRKETIVSFGQDYLVEDQIRTEEKEVEKIRQGIVALDRLMLKYAAPSMRAQLDAVRKKKVLLLKMLEKRGRKLIFLRDKFEVHFPSEIVVKGSLFPGVNIESHGRLYEVQQKKNAVRITFNLMTGKIEEVPL